MATLFVELIPVKQAESVQTSQYIATGVIAIIDKFTATNTSSSNVTFSVNIVLPAGTPSDANLIVDSQTIAPNKTYTFPELVGQSLSPSSFISTVASASSSLTIKSSGREIT